MGSHKLQSHLRYGTDLEGQLHLPTGPSEWWPQMPTCSRKQSASRGRVQVRLPIGIWGLGQELPERGFYVYPTLPGPLPFPGAFPSTYGSSGRVFCPVVQIHERRQEPVDLYRILHRVAGSLGSSPVLVGRRGLGSRELVHLDCNCEI